MYTIEFRGVMGVNGGLEAGLAPFSPCLMLIPPHMERLTRFRGYYANRGGISNGGYVRDDLRFPEVRREEQG